jgi:predicted DNA-binding transcriptional regulator AlpA
MSANPITSAAKERAMSDKQKPLEMHPDAAWTLDDVCRYLQCSRAQLDYYRRNGFPPEVRLPSPRDNAWPRYLAGDVMAWFKQHRVAA